MAKCRKKSSLSRLVSKLFYLTGTMIDSSVAAGIAFASVPPVCGLEK